MRKCIKCFVTNWACDAGAMIQPKRTDRVQLKRCLGCTIGCIALLVGCCTRPQHLVRGPCPVYSGAHISLGRAVWCQHGAFSGVGAFVVSFVPAECPVGGGYVGHIRKALEKGYSEHPRVACCTDNMLEIFVRFGRCLCCFLPVFVNRQPLCPHTNSRNVLSLPLMHHRNLWGEKERALGVKIGCR